MKQQKQYLFSALQSVFQGRSFEGEVLELINVDDKFRDQLNQILHNHNLAARAYRINYENKRSNSQFWKDLEKAYLTSIQSSHMFLSHANQLFAYFKQEGIELAFIKGPVLAKRIYQNSYDRVFHDLDIYFPYADPHEIVIHMQSLGYEPLKQRHKFYANKDKIDFFYHGDPKACVEVHFALGYEKYKIEPKIFLDQDSGFPVLDVESDFQFLLFHAGVQHRFQKLTWLLDLALFQDRFGFILPGINERLSQSSHQLNRCYQIMKTILNFYQHASPCELPPDWILGLIDEDELTKWQISNLRMKIQGKGPFLKYMFYRFIGKYDHAGH